MLGRQSPQGELFRPDNLYLEHVGRDSFYGFLATVRHELFRDHDFAGLYRKDYGRPSVPPSQLCVALLLQTREGVSDDEAIQRTAFDLRWKVALGLEVDEKLCAKSTLQLFRAKLVLHEKFQDVFQQSIEACRQAGLLKRKKLEVALDSTPVFGRGAVKDTFNLISDQIRAVAREVAALKGYELEKLVAEQGLGRHFGSSLKSHFDIDWDDPDQKRAVVGQLVADARVTLELAKAALRGHARGAEHTQELRQARDLLADLLLQDIDEEPEDGEGPCIHQGTKKDRIVSTTDPEMRHGRKSPSKTFDGYKASVAAETDAGVIVAVDVQPANSHDGESAAGLVREASRRCNKQADRVLGDTAYGSIDTRRDLAQAGVEEVIAKVPPLGNRGVKFTLDDFKINAKRGTAVCPAGKKSIRRDRVTKPSGWRYVFSRKDCNRCPLRGRCTTAKVSARVVTITEHTEELQRLRAFQRTKKFKKRYRGRVVVEHRIARLVQLGIRQARYLGRVKVAFQITLAATVANLVLAASTGRDGFMRALQELEISLRFAALSCLAHLQRIGDRRSDSKSFGLALIHANGQPQMAPSRPGL